MYVEWTMRVQADGLVLVVISHEFSPNWPIVGEFIARHVVGGFFVHNIAGKTLACIKQLAENEV